MKQSKKGNKESSKKKSKKGSEVSSDPSSSSNSSSGSDISSCGDASIPEKKQMRKKRELIESDVEWFRVGDRRIK